MASTAADELEIKWSLWSGQVVNNQLNPIHLALGIRGYQIQSEVLHIPTRWGIFSPGPPRLQVYESHAFASTCLIVALIATWTILNDVIIYIYGRLDVETVVFCLCGVIVIAALCFLALCFFPPQHRQGYVWDDWEMSEAVDTCTSEKNEW
ncbi:hypothetical protein GGS24DRAFT_471207 [Hypoxylon argillaceum]|nr:hypothetical protein GGS24DRAFT_471207 [Hypoxylon argillaceum]